MEALIFYYQSYYRQYEAHFTDEEKMIVEDAIQRKRLNKLALMCEIVERRLK